jgi:hypothetical protein
MTHVSCPVANQFLNIWLGNGDVDCGWIVVGLEEGGTDDRSNASLQFDYWCSQGHPQLTDWRHKQAFLISQQNGDPHKDVAGDLPGNTGCNLKSEAYIKFVLDMVFYVENGSFPDDQERCQTLRHRYGRNSASHISFPQTAQDIVTTLEMFPLSAAYSNKETWASIYDSGFTAHGFASKDDYETWCEEHRYPRLRDWIIDRFRHAKQPPHILIVGMHSQQSRLLSDVVNQLVGSSIYSQQNVSSAPDKSSVSILERSGDGCRSAVIQVWQPSAPFSGGEGAVGKYRKDVGDAVRSGL